MVLESTTTDCIEHARPVLTPLSHRRPRHAVASLLPLLWAGVVTAGQLPGQHWPATHERGEVPPPGVAGAGALVVHATRAELLAAAAGMALRHEDFAAGFTTSGMVSVCFQSVGHLSNDPCFAPGDVQPGFGIRSSRGSIFDQNLSDVDVVVLGEAVLGTPTKVVGANIPDPPWNPTRIDFDPHPTVIGMDVYDGMQGQTVQLWVYDASEQLIGSFTVEPTATNAPAFAGFVSPVPVRRVELNALANGGAELIGELVYGGGAGRLIANQDEVDFGILMVGDMVESSLHLRNDGHLDLIVPPLPALPEAYLLVDDACTGASLAMAQSCTLQLAFAPGHEGRFDTLLRFTDDAAAQVRLRAQARGPRLAAVPGHLDFGSVSAGTNSVAQTLTLSNLTGATVNVSAPVSVAPPFVRTGGDCDAGSIQLVSGASCTLELAFAPGSAGDFDAELRVFAGAVTVARATLFGNATQGRGGIQ